ncbi:Hint domain-containing protein [Halomonas elongata]|uniref:Hint domain-containing protein n=1 Tax=Halomonas elongata TaxID=2746 RepID=UPI00186B6E21|nr:Hint domain-containing protein [Halomonas elongata]MBW5799011.1 Hint domain-containing protein [Halomonas elongata]
MAILDVNLGGSETRTISDQDASDGDTLNITALGSSELIVDGVSVSIQDIANIEAGSTPTFTATNGGSLTMDQGLLDLSALNDLSFGIDGNSDITLDASSVSTLSGLNGYNVNFSGAETGSFTFNKPDVGLLDTYNFNVTGMEAGDELNLGGENWSLDEGSILNPQDAYRDGALHLTQGNAAIGTQVNASIEMTQAEYDEFVANQDTYLSGGTYTHNCFAAGTMIATPDGEVPVESLSIGDLVLTASGEQVPVKWIGRQSVHRLFSAGHAPVRISESALEPGVPNQDLVLTANHGVLVDGLVINAGALINHDTIDYLPWNEMPEAITYYHIETDTHEVVIANGTEAETYIDYVDRQAFDNYAEYVALYGIETRVVEMPRHRISSRRLLPLALRERLGIQDMTPATKTA